MGEFPLDFQPQMQDISQQQKLSQMLLQQGMQQPQGQMISGHYVKPAFTQYLNPLFSAYAGSKGMETAEQKQLELAKQLREGKSEALSTFQQLMSKPETRAQAMQYAAKSPYLQGMAQELMKPQKLGEGENLVMPSIGGGEPVNLATGGAKYHAPLQIDTGTAIEIRDPLDPTKVLQRLPKSQMPTAGTVYESPNGPMLIDTRTGLAKPVMANGQPLPSNKPLPEGATGQVTGVENVKSALKDLKNNLQNFSTFDMANPNKRALMSTDYENTILQLKEAMKLGVLNGNDYTILTSMITDPNSPKALLLDKKTQMQQIENLGKKLDEMTKNVYKTHNREVPTNLQNPSAPSMPKIDPTLLQYMTPEQRKLFGG